MTRRQRRRAAWAARDARRFRARAGWTLLGMPVDYTRSPLPKKERHRFRPLFVRLSPRSNPAKPMGRRRHWPSMGAVVSQKKPHEEVTTERIFELYRKFSSPADRAAGLMEIVKDSSTSTAG